MLNFETISEISFLVNVLEQTLLIENGYIIHKDNYCEFVQNTFDT